MKVRRRQFLKASLGALGATAAGATGLGLDPVAAAEQAAAVPIKTGKQVPSVCPYCSVGCGVLVMVDEAGRIVDIAGNPESPINEGTLCPKGAATRQLLDNEQRWATVKYRAPGSDRWEEKPLDWAMDRIAALVKQTRDAHFNEYEELPDGKGGTAKQRVMNTYALASLGGATISDEWNYAQQKLMHGLGVVAVENQARI
jgi:formate dehydrogenase major subunit